MNYENQKLVIIISVVVSVVISQLLSFFPVQDLIDSFGAEGVLEYVLLFFGYTFGLILIVTFALFFVEFIMNALFEK